MITFTTIPVLATSLGLHEKLIQFFNADVQQVVLIDESIGNPEVSVSKNGVTINVNQTIADPYGIYILYDIILPENLEFTDDVLMNAVLSAEYEKINSEVNGGTFTNIILEQDKNKRTVLYYQRFTAPIKSGSIKLIFMELTQRTADKSGVFKYETLIEGTWEVEWIFDYVDTSKTLELTSLINIQESGISKIVISPIGIYLFVDGEDAINNAHLVIEYKDGQEYAFEINDGMYYLKDSATESYENALFYRFDNILNLDDVANIVVENVTIPVN